MHELSIAENLVQVASDHAAREGVAKVCAVTIKLGALTCVRPGALTFCFQAVTEGTLLQDARLRIIEVPVSIFCQRCDREVVLSGIQQFRCTECGTPSADIRQGNELEIETIEVIDEPLSNV